MFEQDTTKGSYIERFLEKYKNLTATDVVVKETIIEIVQKRLNIELSKDKIKYSGGIVYVEASSMVKSKIFIQKKILLEDLKQRLGRKSPKDFR